MSYQTSSKRSPPFWLPIGTRKLLCFSAQSDACVKLRYDCGLLLLGRMLGDPGADSGGAGKSKRVGKYGTKKSKERREEPLGTISYQTSSKRSPPVWLLIGARKLVFFWHQSEARTAATVGTGLVRHCPQGLFSPFFTFLLCHIFPPV